MTRTADLPLPSPFALRLSKRRPSFRCAAIAGALSHGLADA